MPATPPADPRAVIAQPAWETAMRTKARDTVLALNTMAVQASPITFVVQGINVQFSWGDNDARLAIGDGLYSLKMPLSWITGKTT